MEPHTPAAQQSRGSGKKWTIIALSVILVATLGVGGFLLVKKDDASADGSPGEVFVTAAADAGQDPFSDSSFAATPDTTIAQTASGGTPSSQSVSLTANTGDQPGLYGGTNNLIACDADKMVAFLKANPDKAKAWVDALNSDPDLRYDGTLTTATIPQYLSTLTPIVLVADTRVTNHGFANGAATELQSILQKGTGVFVDKYGVPRVRCACGNPLAAPKASKTAPKYRGKTWADFSLSKVTVVQPAKAQLTSFQIRVPAKPTTSGFKQIAIGPFACAVTPGSVCKTPSGVVKKSATGIPGAPTTTTPPPSSSPASSPASSTPASSSPASTPSSSPASTSPPSSASSSGGGLSTKQGTITFGLSQRGKDTNYSLKFAGYSPNSTVKFTCSDSKKTLYSGSATMDASGGNSSGQAYCFTPNPGFQVRDHLGTTFSP